MKCYCKIKRVLTPVETFEFNKLLAAVGRKGTNSDKLAELESWEKSGECEFFISWGFAFYCSNPERIDEFLE